LRETLACCVGENAEPTATNPRFPPRFWHRHSGMAVFKGGRQQSEILMQTNAKSFDTKHGNATQQRREQQQHRNINKIN